MLCRTAVAALSLSMLACGTTTPNDNGTTSQTGSTTTGGTTSSSSTSQGGGSAGGGSQGGSSQGGSSQGSGGTTGSGGTGSGGSGTGGNTPTIWQPAPGTSWQWQLTGSIDTSVNVKVYDIDLFDVGQATIDKLHKDGRIVICYFSGGSYEEWRSDAKKFPKGDIGKPLDGWPGEAWLDVRSSAIRAIMAARLDLAKSKKCDAVEPDNMDGYANNNGKNLKYADQIDYNKWMAAEAHKRGLSVGLKNDVDQLGDLASSFDWALNEECYSYNECKGYKTHFTDKGKAVFHAEYVSASQAGKVCASTKPLGLSTIIKKLDLDAWRVACP